MTHFTKLLPLAAFTVFTLVGAAAIIAAPVPKVKENTMGLTASVTFDKKEILLGEPVYFTFAVHPAEASQMRDTYLDCWRRVIEASVNGGGGIAHHHGIGRIRREWLRSEIGETGVTALRAVKQALDPIGFMNPGALIPKA